MSLLPSEPLNFTNGEALDPDARERLFDLVEFERLDDRLNLFHIAPLLLKCRDREPHHRNFQYSNSCSRAPAMHVQSHLEPDANQMPALDEVSRTTSGARVLSESAKDGKIGTSHQCILHDYVFPA